MPDLQKLLATVSTAVQGGNWQAVAALVLVFCVYLLRKYASKVHGQLGAWLNTDRGGSTLVMVTGVTCAAATTLLAGQKLTVNLLLTGLTTGALASGARNVVYDLFWPSDKPAPSPTPGTVLSGDKPAVEPTTEKKP